MGRPPANGLAAAAAGAARVFGAVALVRPQVAGAPDAALHFVVNEQRVELVGQGAQPGEKGRRGRMDAALTLDRLHDDGADRGVHLVARTGQVVELGEAHARHQREKGILVFRARRRGQAAHGAAMKGVGEGQDVDLFVAAVGAPVAAGELERAFVRFGAAVTKVNAVGKARFTQELRQLRVGRRVIQVAHVKQPGRHALRHRLLDARIGVAQRIHGDAGHAVDVGAVVAVIERRTLAPRQHKRRPPVDAEDVVVLHFNDLLCVHVASPSCCGVLMFWGFRVSNPPHHPKTPRH